MKKVSHHEYLSLQPGLEVQQTTLSDKIETLKKELSTSVAGEFSKVVNVERLICKNPNLQPAFDYIHEHRGNNVTQQNLAELCHMSTSHFSRIFKKEMQMTFPQFLSLQKIEWAKQLLLKTSLSVNQISDELGFNDPGYFIKIFKKYESHTPNQYRKYLA